MIPAMGSVTFLENSGSGDYNIVFINAYDNYYVSSINADDMKIMDNGSSIDGSISILDIDEQDTKVIVDVYSDDRSIDFEDIPKESIISVYKSKDNKLYTIMLSEETISGSVQEYLYDTLEVVIDDDTYKFAENFKEKAEKSVRIGDEGTFYLDIEGNIAYFERDNSEGKRNYGFLWNSGFSYESLKNSTELEIFNRSGEFVIYKCADKVKVDGKQVKNSDVHPLVQNSYTNIIGYETNNNDEITLIDLPIDVGSDWEPEQAEPDNSLVRKYMSMRRTYKTEYRSFISASDNANSMYLSDSVIVFRKPSITTGEELPKERLSTMSLSNFSSDIDYPVEGYCTNTELVDIVVSTEAVSTGTNKAGAILVSNVATAINSDGDMCRKIVGIRDGNDEYSVEVELNSNAEKYILGINVNEDDTPEIIEYNKLKRGDVILVSTDSEGYAFDYYKLLNFDKNIELAEQTSVGLATGLNVSKALYGESVKIKYKLLWIKNSTGTYCYPMINTRVYLYDTIYDKIFVKTIDDVQEGQFMLIRLTNENIREIIIYN